MDRVYFARAALAEAIEEMEDMVTYVPDYFRQKWQFDNAIESAKAKLAELPEEP